MKYSPTKTNAPPTTNTGMRASKAQAVWAAALVAAASAIFWRCVRRYLRWRRWWPQGGPARGSDLRYTLELSLEDAVKGTSVKIKVPTLVSCKTCDGSGAKSGTKPATCTTCGGHGQVRMQQGFSRYNKPAPPVAARAKSSPTPVKTATATAALRKLKPSM